MDIVYTKPRLGIWMKILFLLMSSMVSALTIQPAFASEVVPNDSFWSRQWYLRQIHAPEAWTMSTGSHRVVVAVIDGGVDINHPDLRENIWTNPQEIPGDGIDNDNNGYVDDLHGWDFITQKNDVGPIPSRNPQSEESWSHGTFVSSLIGAKGNNGIGIAGVTWNVQIMSLVVLNGDGFGNMQSIIDAVHYAVQKHVDVINLSLSGNEYNDDLEAAIKEARNAGVFIVSATGNDEGSEVGINTDETPIYPVCMDANMNAVFGVGGTDTLDQKAPYANFGRGCTDLVAPAQEFFGARPSYRRPTDTSTTTANYLDGMTGTSLAAPLVSGAAALLKSVRPDLTPTQITDTLRYSADPIETNLEPSEQGRMGAGRLNVAKALARVMPVASAPASPFTQSLQSGVFIQSAHLEGHWRTWTHTEPVSLARWLVTSTDPQALAMVTTTSAWKREIWHPITNKVTSTVLWTRATQLPMPAWNASTTRLLFLKNEASSLVAIMMDPVTNQRSEVSLPHFIRGTSITITWWAAKQSWIVWSTIGQGTVINEKGQIIGTVSRITQGRTTAVMKIRSSATGIELVQGTKRVSVLRFEPKREL